MALRGALGLVFALGFVPLGCGSPPEPAPVAGPSPVAVDPKAEPVAIADLAVASDCEAATRVAVAIVERGGSAADAAIAGLLVAGVVEPASSGLGGGGVAIVAAGDEVTVLDFRPRAPQSADTRAVERALAARDRASRAALVAVPGELAGIAALHRLAGRLPLAVLFEPALEAARNGFVASPRLAAAVQGASLEGELADLLLPAGEPIRAGQPVPAMPALARTLEALAHGGEAAFYTGVVAAEIAGGPLGLDDLASYRAEVVAAVASPLDDFEVLTAPTRGGLIVAEALRFVRPAPGPDGLDELARAIQLARRDVVRHEDLTVDELLAPERVEQLRRSVGASPSSPGGTTSLVVVSGDEIVAISSTLGEPFGARIARAGVVLNGQLADFARPQDVRRFGARPVAPGAVVPTSLSPTLVRRDGRLVFALTASGGEHIPSALVQVLFGLAGGASPEEAVAAPRIRVPAGGGLWLEPGSEETLAAALRARGHHVRNDLPAHDGVQLVALGARLEATVDARKGGAAAVRR